MRFFKMAVFFILISSVGRTDTYWTTANQLFDLSGTFYRIFKFEIPASKPKTVVLTGVKAGEKNEEEFVENASQMKGLTERIENRENFAVLTVVFSGNRSAARFRQQLGERNPFMLVRKTHSILTVVEAGDFVLFDGSPNLKQQALELPADIRYCRKKVAKISKGSRY